MYERLNVRFDVYDGESMYAATEEHTSRVLGLLESKELLRRTEDGRKVIKRNGTIIQILR